MYKTARLLTTFLFACCLSAQAQGPGTWRGNVTLEGRFFLEEAQFPDQQHENGSISFQPEYSREWDDGYQQFVFTPFLRLDQHDPERSHADIRELFWQKSGATYDLRLGIRHVFWGVTESQHLVDIINQTDLIENVDGEDKLGQPMLNV